jgi:capsular polysaccharide biosynthesis protein
MEDYFFSAPTAMTGCTNPYAVRFLRERFLPYADKEFHGPAKIYLVRRGGTRGVINDEEVEAFLSKRGWTPVIPETPTLAQQIRLFADARAVCGVHGGALTNILWCSPGCSIIELMAERYCGTTRRGGRVSPPALRLGGTSGKPLQGDPE